MATCNEMYARMPAGGLRLKHVLHMQTVTQTAATRAAQTASARLCALSASFRLPARGPSNATGLAPEIVFFRTAPGALDFPKAHSPDVGGADLHVKQQV